LLFIGNLKCSLGPFFKNIIVLTYTSFPLKDLGDIGKDKLPKTMKVDFPNPDDLFNFELTITPDEGKLIFFSSVTIFPPLSSSCNQSFSFSILFFLIRILSLGFYKGGSFKFSFKINSNYPHEPPKVLCIPKVYHPNIDLEGNVCLNILREDWKPVLNINSVLVGLQYLFLEPNADDPLNKGKEFFKIKNICKMGIKILYDYHPNKK